MDSLTLNAYAKINLGLKILNRRDDGFHDIITLFQRVSLADTITLEQLDDGVIEYDGPALTGAIEDNLCWRAADAFHRLVGANPGVRIRLEKRIPYSAGLGGGSSDAAAILTGMGELAGLDRRDPRLAATGLLLGSDVPFFVSGSSACLAQGRGERLEPAESMAHDSGIVILWSGKRVLTSEAYQIVDQILTFDINIIKIVTREFTAHCERGSAWAMGNDFESPVFSAIPDLASARNRLLEQGAFFAGLSGSGSALFGLFSDIKAARIAAGQWNAPWAAYLCQPV